MKTYCRLLLGLTLSTRAFAQPAVNTNANSASTASPPPTALSPAALEKINHLTPIFDGKTLDGWVQAPAYVSSFAGDDLADLPALAKKLSAKSDPVSAFISNGLDDTLRQDLASFSADSTNARTLTSGLAKALNRIVSTGSVDDPERFRNTTLRPETVSLRNSKPTGPELARLNRMLLEDTYPAELMKSPATSWVVKEGAMASLGAGRGTIYTRKSYGNYRLIFTMRHAGVQPGQSDHMPCVLIYCTAPPAGEKGLDALAGIQFQTPNGGSWDYRPGRNNSGREFFTRVPHPRFDPREWHQVELLVNTNGTARMAVAQPVGTKAYEVLVFHDPAAGKSGPVAWQMHNKGLLDEYKDVRIEEDPKDDKLITVE